MIYRLLAENKQLQVNVADLQKTIKELQNKGKYYNIKQLIESYIIK